MAFLYYFWVKNGPLSQSHTALVLPKTRSFLSLNQYLYEWDSGYTVCKSEFCRLSQYYNHYRLIKVWRHNAMNAALITLSTRNIKKLQWPIFSGLDASSKPLWKIGPWQFFWYSKNRSQDKFWRDHNGLTTTFLDQSSIKAGVFCCGHSLFSKN